MSHFFVCQHCGECCKRYDIIIMPREADRQAKYLNLGLKNFVQTKTRLFLQIFFSDYSDSKLVIQSSFLPKRIVERFKERVGALPNFFVALPMIALVRNNGACVFYDEEKGCLIYEARPLECILFPFISRGEIKDYSKAYHFCHGLRFKGNVCYEDFSKIHFKEVFSYCEEIKKKGFSKVWKAWPKKGHLVFEDKTMSEISIEEFKQTILPYW
ncbi:MAG: YkgJ family cysteine cluster protein [Candidatus Diapherotrites archaeon]